MTRLVIQIPAYNEAETLPAMLEDIPREFPGIDDVIVILIDDGSVDDTAKIALEYGVDYVIQHRVNRGLSTTFLTGLLTALALGADIIVNTDADHQYLGKEIQSLVRPVLDGKADLVIGDRRPLMNDNFSKTKGFLENLGSWVVRNVSKTDVPDAVSGFRAYSRYAALRLQVHNRYSYTIETLIQAGQEKMKIVHVPVNTNPTVRPSRLHKGLFNFILNQGGAIIRSLILYQPLATFSTCGSVFLAIGGGFLLRFLIIYLMGDSGIGRYIQSVSIGGTLSVFGFLLIILGFLGDAIRANHNVAMETMIRLRDTHRISDLNNFTEINGEPVYCGNNLLVPQHA